MLRHQARLCARHLGLAAAILFACAPAAGAWENARLVLPAEPGTPIPGLHGILENDGDHIHNVGNVALNITNFGIIGAMPGSRQSFDWAASAQWPFGSGAEYLWGAGLWVGAERDDMPHVSAWYVENDRVVLEYLPDLGDAAHIYTAHELDPGGLRAPSPRADDDGDGSVDEDPLDGRDNDVDGRIDEDYAAISDQMFVCEYRDDAPQLSLAAPDHRPLGIQVRQTSMAWSAPEIDDFITLRFDITNVGTSPLRNMFVGFHADFDIGGRYSSAVGQDDMAGFWEGQVEIPTWGVNRNERLSIGYMFDANGDRGQAPGYVGIVFLGVDTYFGVPSRQPIPLRIGPRPGDLWLHNFHAFTRAATGGGHPTNDDQRYAILNGTSPNALESAFLRKPRVSTVPNDYRIVVSARATGNLRVGSTFTFQVAMVFGNTLEEMIDTAVRAIQVYRGDWVDADDDPKTGVDGKEFSICGPEYAGAFVEHGVCLAECLNLPPGDPLCWSRVPDQGCIWFDLDCGQETGVDGKEFHVPWGTPAAPQPPAMRVVAHQGRIDVLWNNRSERAPDPLRGVVDFESYRIWRADGWTRPAGSNAVTGPGTTAWFLMDEYDVVNNVGANRGLGELAYSPDVPADAVDFYRAWFAEHPDEPAPDLPGLNPAQADTAKALARGVAYYRYIDPPFVPEGHVGGPCPETGMCPPIETPDGRVPARCHPSGRCVECTGVPASGLHVFYAVTATDHRIDGFDRGDLRPTGLGIVGQPNTNFVYVVPPSTALEPADFATAEHEIYVVPNPATAETMADWTLQPNQHEPSGTKIEFHHLPRGTGTIRIWTLAGDLVDTVPFDARDGNGSQAWDLLSRNGQEITSGVYLFTVDADIAGFARVTGRFVVIR